MKKENGLIHIYCGEGKGKTTAAFGLALRAAGRGWRVQILQFLKNGNSGEALALKQIQGVTVESAAIDKFVFLMTEEEKQQAREKQERLLDQVMEQEDGLLVLDEALGAVESGTLDVETLVEAVLKKSPKLELVLTGRKMIGQLRDRADYISVISPEKHPYEKGIPAREGIEF